MSSRFACFAIASAALVLGLTLAWHHPITPPVCLAGFMLVALVTWRWPGRWLVFVPATLPILNFSPWTGWLMFEEFDLMLLATLAGGFAHLGQSGRSGPGPDGFGTGAATPWTHDRIAFVLLGLLALAGAWSLLRGLGHADAVALDWFAGYTSPLNSLRVAKSFIFALLFVPLLRLEIARTGELAASRLARGMCLGLAVVVIAALWERAAFPGLLDFSAVYRVTALFWELHVGGGAMDVYLAMASPFAVWLALNARSPRQRGIAVVCLLGLAYVCIATVSRGLYVALSVVAVGSLVVWRRGVVRRIRQHPASLAAVLVVIAVFMVLTGPHAFLMNRFDKIEKDLDKRFAHWELVIGLLKTPLDWALGIGVGRLPAALADGRSGVQLPGAVSLQSDSADQPGVVRLHGPTEGKRLGGLFALTQRVAIVPEARYRFSGQFRAGKNTQLLVQVCERHLLYDWDCHGALVVVPATGAGWKDEAVDLRGDTFSAPPWFAPRLGMLSIAVLNNTAAVDMKGLGLVATGTGQLLSNSDFSAGLARWFPAAQYYFLPWHADSLFVELLVERGLVALALTAGLLALVLRRLMRRPFGEKTVAWAFFASVCGAVAVGSFSSVLDVPRTGFLFFLLLVFSLLFARQPASVDMREPMDLPAAGGR